MARKTTTTKKTSEPKAEATDKFMLEREDGATRANSDRIKVLKNGLIFDPKQYEFKEDFVPSDPSRPMEAHTTAEMVECLKRDKNIQLEARVLGWSPNGRARAKMSREAFLECYKRRDSKRLRESFDQFNFDSQPVSGLVGSDFAPLLGGPFAKQLYYRDYLRMIASCFFAFHHDPAARDVVSIIGDFTIGRGFKLNTSGPDKDKAQILWDAFAKVNKLDEQFDYCGSELSIYGEVMWWKLPMKQTRIVFNPVKGDKIPTGIIPRIRLIDPSNIAEIITIPEDIMEGVLYYVWLAPTQYQMYTDGHQPTTKFIYTQIPADQIKHVKVNTVSNEKRGRSDFFPALGYMKRLRDSVNYSLIAQQKASAWCIDTTIKGNDTDLDNYVADQQAMGTIPPAGSEFVHTESVARTYLSNSATSKGADSPAFSWCMNMIAMSTGIPLSYFGTHLSGAGTRANALVSTEPVAKRFERRRNVYDRMLHSMFDDLMRYFGLNADCEIVFPELITQDRSALLRDLALAQMQGWLARETAAEKAAKEFDQKDYSFESEQQKILKDPPVPLANPAQSNPLTAPPAAGQTQKSNGTLTSTDKNQIKSNLRTL